MPAGEYWDYQLIQNYVYPRATFGEEPYATKLKAPPDELIPMFRPERDPRRRRRRRDQRLLAHHGRRLQPHRLGRCLALSQPARHLVLRGARRTMRTTTSSSSAAAWPGSPPACSPPGYGRVHARPRVDRPRGPADQRGGDRGLPRLPRRRPGLRPGPHGPGAGRGGRAPSSPWPRCTPSSTSRQRGQPRLARRHRRKATYRAPAADRRHRRAPRPLGVPGEERLAGRGVSHCATCDGPLFKGRPVGVAGGGDCALQEALTLAGYASRVVVLHPEPDFPAQATLRRRVCRAAGHRGPARGEVLEVLGNGAVAGVRLRDVAGGAESDLDLAALFVYAGWSPTPLPAGRAPPGAGRPHPHRRRPAPPPCRASSPRATCARTPPATPSPPPGTAPRPP